MPAISFALFVDSTSTLVKAGGVVVVVLGARVEPKFFAHSICTLLCYCFFCGLTPTLSFWLASAELLVLVIGYTIVIFAVAISAVAAETFSGLLIVGIATFWYINGTPILYFFANGDCCGSGIGCVCCWFCCCFFFFGFYFLDFS